MAKDLKQAQVTTAVGVLVYLIQKDQEPQPLVCTQFQDQGQELLLGRPFLDGGPRFYELFKELAQKEEWFDMGIVFNAHPDLHTREPRGILYSRCTLPQARLCYSKDVFLLDQVHCRYESQGSWRKLPSFKLRELVF